MDPKQITRRWFFEQCGVGLGAAALGHLLAESGFATQPTHFPAKAKHVIFLFMAGAPSHLELFDYKPQLAKFDGTFPPAELLKGYAQPSSIPTPSCSAEVPIPPLREERHRAERTAALHRREPTRSPSSNPWSPTRSITAPGQLLMNTGTMRSGGRAWARGCCTDTGR